MTYEHGKAPADAPVTWQRYESGRFVTVFDIDGRAEMATCVVKRAADAICRAFHLAALAEEAAPWIEDAYLGGTRLYHTADGRDWKRRFDAAKGAR